MPLFKRKEKKPAAPTTQQGIERINTTLDTIRKKEEYLNTQISEMNMQIKQKLQTGDREGAKAILRRRKMLETQLKTTQGAMMNLERQQVALDGAAFNKEILDTMKAGNDAMKAAMGDMDADKVADLMDDMQEQQDLMEEINQTMLGDYEAFNDEIAGELDEIETQMQESALLNDGMEKVHSNPAPAAPVQDRAAESATTARQQEQELASFFG